MSGPMTDFAGRVAAITGAASGIGRALAIELAGRGSDIAICDVDEEGLAETKERVRALGRRVFARRVDVADRGAMFAFADDVVRELGRADAIVNNAGVSVSHTLEEMSFEDLEWIVGINFWGVVHGTKAFLPKLRARNDGWIVNVSSVFGFVSFPTQSAYNATKFAVRGLTESLRQELEGSGITVACVHPGGIKTNIVRKSRFYRAVEGHDDQDKAVREFEKMARTTPEGAAKTIARGMIARSPRILIGADAHVIETVSRLAPVRYPQVFAAIFNRLPK